MVLVVSMARASAVLESPQNCRANKTWCLAKLLWQPADLRRQTTAVWAQKTPVGRQPNRGDNDGGPGRSCLPFGVT